MRKFTSSPGGKETSFAKPINYPNNYGTQPKIAWYKWQVVNEKIGRCITRSGTGYPKKNEE